MNVLTWATWTVFLTLSLLAREPAARPMGFAAPYPASPVIADITWDLSGLRREGLGSDLWPVTWADDDNLYTSWGDGVGFGAVDYNEQFGPARAYMGVSRISGSGDTWQGSNVFGGKNPESPSSPFPGKSNGILSVGGTLYMHVIEQDLWWRAKICRSTDHGRTWTFNEGAFSGTSWDFAEPDGAFADMTFLTFGKDYQGARDGYVYVYSFDKSRDATGNVLEITDGVGMFRVLKDRIMTRSAYEYFAGLDAGNNPLWTTDITRRKAVFSNPGAVGWGVRMQYNAGLRRYLLTTFHRSDGSWGIFDAPEPWGPWTTVAYYANWIDSTPKFGFTFPPKWMSADGTTMYMVFSGTNVYDSINVIKAKLTLRSAPVITSPAAGTIFAPGQSVTATGTGTNLSWSIDRIGDGLPAFATGTGSSITFTVPADSTSSQTIQITLTGAGGSAQRSYSISGGSTPTVITSPAAGTIFTPGQGVTATGTGTNLSWSIDRIGDGLPAFATGTGSSITFTVPANSTSSQTIQITLTGTGGIAQRSYSISGASPFSVTIDYVSTGKAYSVSTAQAGALYYIDRSYTISPLSAALNGRKMIRTANDDKYVTAPTHLKFTVSATATVYVCYDKRATQIPSWLNDGTWTVTAESFAVTDTGASPMRVYRKAVPSGQVTLGGNRASPASGAGSNYVVVVTP